MPHEGHDVMASTISAFLTSYTNHELLSTSTDVHLHQGDARKEQIVFLPRDPLSAADGILKAYTLAQR